MYFLKKKIPLRGMVPTKLVYSNDDHEKVYHNCKFHNLRGKGSCTRVWPYKMYYFFSVDQGKVFQIVNLITSEYVLVLKRCNKSHIVKMLYFF